MSGGLIFAAVTLVVGAAEPFAVTRYLVRRKKLRYSPPLACAVAATAGAVVFAALAFVFLPVQLPPRHFASAGFAGTAAGEAIAAVIAWTLWRRR